MLKYFSYATIASFVTNATPEAVKMYKMPYKTIVPKYVPYTEPVTLSQPPLLTFSYREGAGRERNFWIF